jgi:hypothetical protein
MSKNHPNDNMYSILGKLEALKPTPEEKRFALVKEIRESVEAKGSVLQGVDAVQARLAKQFSETTTNEAIRVAGNTKGPVGHYSQMKHVGKDGSPEAQAHRDATAAMAKSARAAGSKLPFNKTTEPTGKLASGGYNAMTKGVTPVKINELSPELLKRASDAAGMKWAHADDRKDQKASEKYSAQNDKFHSAMRKKQKDLEECAMCESGNCEEHMNEDLQADDGQYGSEQDLPEGETTYKNGVTTHRKTDFPGYPVDDNDDIEDTNKGKRGRPRKHAVKVAKTDAEGNKLGRGRPAKVKAPTYTKMSDPFGRTTGAVPKPKVKGRVHTLDEAMSMVETNLTEGRHMVDESGETLKHILNRFKHEVKQFEAGEDIYGTDLYHALYDYYCDNGEMPYGTQKARDGDPAEWISNRLDLELSNNAYGSDPANKEEADEAIDPANSRDYEIPAYIRKASGQAPLTQRDVMQKDKKPEHDFYQRRTGETHPDALKTELDELAKLAGIHTEGNAFSGKLANTAKGDSFEQDGETFTNNSSIADKELDEEETDEGNAFGQAVRNAKADGVQDGEKVKVDGKEIAVKESMEMPGSEESNFNISTSLSSDGNKNVTVSATGEHAASLLQMLRIAGLGDGAKAQELQAEPEMGQEEPGIEVIGIEPEQEVDESGIDVDDAGANPVNAPDPQYASMKGSTMGPGEGDAGEKAMNPDRPTKNNGDNALATPPTRAQKTLIAVSALESKLAAEYESIKKLS